MNNQKSAASAEKNKLESSNQINTVQTENNMSQGTNSNTIDLAELESDRGFSITGTNKIDPRSMGSGFVSDAGDINNDGFDDIIFSKPFTDLNGREGVGRSYVIFGNQDISSSAEFNLDNLNGRNGFVLNGAGEIDLAGLSIASAGDINDDGIDDLAIGAEGKTYVVFGNSQIGNFGEVELSQLNGSNGLVIRNVDVGDRVSSLSSAGDFNNDGVDDLAIGLPGASSNNISQSGEIYVVFGNSRIGNSGEVELSQLNNKNGFVFSCALPPLNNKSIQPKITGDGSNYRCGNSVSSAGDINNDKIDDLVIGAESVSKSYIVFGSKNPSNLRRSDLKNSSGFILEGTRSNERLGSSVSSAGDINNDGIDDLVIGASAAGTDNGATSGASYVIFGDNNLDSNNNLSIHNLDSLDGFIIEGIGSSDLLGSTVSNAGDINGDEIDDIVISAPGADFDLDTNSGSKSATDGGRAFAIFGDREIGNSGKLDLTSLDRSEGFVLQNYGSYGDNLVISDYDRNVGNTISNAGDINGDNIDDIVTGMPSAIEPDDGYVILGHRQITSSGSSLENQTLQLEAGNLSLAENQIATTALSALFISGLLYCLVSKKWRL